MRGALRGELAGQVAMEAIVAMLAFTVLGAVSGWIADHLVRDAMENLFRRRVDWYRQGLADTAQSEEDSSSDESQTV